MTGGPLTAGPVTLTAAAGNDQPTVRELRITDGPDGLQVVLVEGADELGFTVGAGEWISGDAVAASGAVVDGELRIDVVFLETPHRLQLRVPPGSTGFTARWVTAPLWDTPLASLRMPR